MKVIRSVAEMQQTVTMAKCGGRRAALVPTMGALHEGHATLIRKARDCGAAVVVSIYVNPTQFGPHEDFNRYPRDLQKDSLLCAREGADVIFAPTDAEMYPGGTGVPSVSTWVDETALAKRLEGERRPGHFRGVCTVVSKLFNIIQPEIAVFGQKDYQQLKVIQRLTRDLSYPIEIVPVPTMREKDGLAMSSRNQHLAPEERVQATLLWKALTIGQTMFNDGEHNAHRLQSAMQRTLQLSPVARVDYAEVVDADTLDPVHEAKRGNIILLAVHLGKTRLIDNLVL